jgi:hypothetical protein
MADNTHRAKMPENNVIIKLSGLNAKLINGYEGIMNET